jgi:hypothetical protein
MSKEPEKELIEQLMQSGCTESEAEQTIREINEAEQFLYNQDRVEPSPQFMQRLESQIRSELTIRANRFAYPVWLKRVGAIAAAVAIVFIAIIAFRGNQKESKRIITPPPPAEYVTESPELWELELVEFEEPVLQVDDLVISEVLELWTEAQWDIENLFGKENDHEFQITDYAGILCVSHRYA